MKKNRLWSFIMSLIGITLITTSTIISNNISAKYLVDNHENKSSKLSNNAFEIKNNNEILEQSPIQTDLPKKISEINTNEYKYGSFDSSGFRYANGQHFISLSSFYPSVTNEYSNLFPIIFGDDCRFFVDFMYANENLDSLTNYNGKRWNQLWNYYNYHANDFPKFNIQFSYNSYHIDAFEFSEPYEIKNGNLYYTLSGITAMFYVTFYTSPEKHIKSKIALEITLMQPYFGLYDEKIKNLGEYNQNILKQSLLNKINTEYNGNLPSTEKINELVLEILNTNKDFKFPKLVVDSLPFTKNDVNIEYSISNSTNSAQLKIKTVYFWPNKENNKLYPFIYHDHDEFSIDINPTSSIKEIKATHPINTYFASEILAKWNTNQQDLEIVAIKDWIINNKYKIFKNINLIDEFNETKPLVINLKKIESITNNKTSLKITVTLNKAIISNPNPSSNSECPTIWGDDIDFSFNIIDFSNPITTTLTKTTINYTDSEFNNIFPNCVNGYTAIFNNDINIEQTQLKDYMNAHINDFFIIANGIDISVNNVTITVDTNTNSATATITYNGFDNDGIYNKNNQGTINITLKVTPDTILILDEINYYDDLYHEIFGTKDKGYAIDWAALDENQLEEKKWIFKNYVDNENNINAFFSNPIILPSKTPTKIWPSKFDLREIKNNQIIINFSYVGYKNNQLVNNLQGTINLKLQGLDNSNSLTNKVLGPTGVIQRAFQNWVDDHPGETPTIDELTNVVNEAIKQPMNSNNPNGATYIELFPNAYPPIITNQDIDVNKIHIENNNMIFDQGAIQFKPHVSIPKYLLYWGDVESIDSLPFTIETKKIVITNNENKKWWVWVAISCGIGMLVIIIIAIIACIIKSKKNEEYIYD